MAPRQEKEEEYGPGSPDYGLSYEPDPQAQPAEEYGPGSSDYGLSYEPDPWANPEPRDVSEAASSYDEAESMWEAMFRDGHITQEQFQNRRRSGGH